MVKGAPSSGRSDLWLKLALAVASPLLLVFLLEVVAYGWERSQANGLFAWEMVASRRIAFERFLAPGDGYTLMKPYEHYEWQEIPVQINSHGLRSRETSFQKPADTVRILNLGDSVVMGWGVREEETYGRRLEGQLNGRDSTTLSYEVINAGVPGWNLANAAAYLEAQGLSYQPDLIILNVTVANDINGKSALNAVGPPSLLNWLRTRTHFWPFLMIQIRMLQARLAGQERIDTINPPTNPEKYFPRDPAAERWDEVWSWVLAIDRLAEENDAKVVLVMFPLEYQVLDDGYPTLAQELFTARAAEAGIPLIDLLHRFRQACHEKPGGVCRLEDRYLFADVWMHPSAYGHELAAQELEMLLTGQFDNVTTLGVLE